MHREFQYQMTSMTSKVTHCTSGRCFAWSFPLQSLRRWQDSSSLLRKRQVFSGFLRTVSVTSLVPASWSLYEYSRRSNGILHERFVSQGKGFPDVSSRRLVHLIWTSLEIPVLGLMDCDPFGRDMKVVLELWPLAVVLCSQVLRYFLSTNLDQWFVNLFEY